MLEYPSFEKIIDHRGLRIVMVKGVPSPWGQAAKTIFEIKGLDYVAAPWLGGEPNENIVAWGGEGRASVGIVVYSSLPQLSRPGLRRRESAGWAANMDITKLPRKPPVNA